MASGPPHRDAQRRMMRRMEEISTPDKMVLFLEQRFEVAGDIYIKGSRFQRSKKYYAELRGATIALFRCAELARREYVDITAIVSVFIVSQYNVEILQKDGGVPRIYFKCDPGEDDNSLIYIKVMGGRRELDAWRHGLGRAVSCRLPRLREIVIESAIGRGGGGKVFLAFWNQDDVRTPYALKVITKSHAFKSAKSTRHVASERSLMEEIGCHPFLLQMQFAFQTEKNLFIGTTFCPGGDLAAYLRANGETNLPSRPYETCHLRLDEQKKRRVYGRLSEAQTRRIASEIVLGLEHLHMRGIVYRDLKPENIFIDETGHIKLGDFGLAKNLEKWKETGGDQTRTASVCGTRNYLPPEMLFGRTYSYETDLWSLGVMLYRIMCGFFPFEAPRSKELFYKVKVHQPFIPSALSKNARKLLEALLQKDPKNRPTITGLKRYSFFDSIDWEMVYNKKAQPPIPDVKVGDSEVVDALENFELSKLEEVTVGEYVVGRYGGYLEENWTGKPSHKQEVKDMMVGFEYGCPPRDETVQTPLAVKKLTGGVMRVTSNDEDTPSAQKNIVKRLSLNHAFSKLLSGDESIRSPRTVLDESSRRVAEAFHQNS